MTKVAKNNVYKVSVGAPLLRPGVVVQTEVSEQYVKSAVEKLMNIVRDVNETTPPTLPIEGKYGSK